MSDAADLVNDEFEVVDALPVLSDDGHRAIDHAAGEPASLAAVPKRQVLALAASSFFAGAATLALVHARKSAKVTPKRITRSAPSFGDIVGSERFLLDLHRLQR